MARAGAVYPQVDPRAAGLMEGRVLRCAPRLAAARALALADAAGARVLVVGTRAVVRHDELSRAVDWGLERMAVGRLAWQSLPVVAASSPEVAVRRLFMAGAPMVVVRERGRIAGVIEASPVDRTVAGLSIAHRLEQPGGASRDAGLWLCRLAGTLGEKQGVVVWAVGGFVRDVLLGRPALDLDLVVQGDGPAFAQRLAEAIGGRAVTHGAFGTASIEGGRTAGGEPLPRIDVATARRERYAAPGALPGVSPASLAEDLARRDFSVNAIGMALGPALFGRLVDPLGGRADLDRRRLRVLHPLSFVEDPTRLFRAARYSARLGLRMDAGTRRALRLALSVGRYPALSGQRLLAEIELLAVEPTGWQALGLLLRWGVLGLWDPGFRGSRLVARRLRNGRRLGHWPEAAPFLPGAPSTMLVASLLDQRPAVSRRCLARLAVTGARAERLATGPEQGRRLARIARPRGRPASLVAAAFREASPESLAAAWLIGGRPLRRRLRWFATRGHAVRPLLRAEDLLAAGIPRGPRIGGCLRALRDLRLDGRIRTLPGEQRFVEQCRHRRKGGAE